MKKLIFALAMIFILAGVVWAAQAVKIVDGTGTTAMDETNHRVNVNVQDPGAGTQTNDVKITMDGEDVDVQGGVAEDAASTEPPIHIGGIAESTVPTEVSDADAIGVWLDTFGKILIYGANQSVGGIDVNLVNPPPVQDACTHLLDETVNANGESFNATMAIGEADKITVLVWNDETASADDSEVNVTIELSPDNSVFMTAQTGMVNSEDQAAAAAADWTFDTDEERYFWFPQPITAQYLKATVTCDADCDGSDYHAFDLWVCTNE